MKLFKFKGDFREEYIGFSGKAQFFHRSQNYEGEIS